MPNETATDGVPPVPSVWRLGWLLFMQPLALQRMHRAWGLKEVPSGIALWRRARTNDPIARALLAKYAFWLFTAMPLLTGLALSALALTGVAVHANRVAFGVAFGVAVSVAVSMAFGVAISVAFGVAGTVASTVAFDVAGSVAFGMVGGVVGTVAGGMAFGVAFGVAGSLRAVGGGRRSGHRGGHRGGRRGGWRGEHRGGRRGSRRGGHRGGRRGERRGVRHRLSPSATLARRAVVTLLILWRIRSRPVAAHRLVSWLPFRHDDLIYLPLPGLRACLIEVAEIDAALARELIADAAASIGQRRIARSALIELQSRALDRAARGRLWVRAAGLDLPFLPAEADLASDPGNAPIRTFRPRPAISSRAAPASASAGLAIERARSAIESFRVTTIAARRPPALAQRLWSTATLWLDAIGKEAEQLNREVAAHPEVPAAFIAGPPLTPARAEERTLFKGRRDVIKVIEHDLAPDRRGVLVVVGQRRMGKTSLCNYLPTHLGTGTLVVVSNFQPLSGDAHRETPHRRVLGDIAAQAPFAPPPPESDRWGDGLRWLEDLDRSCSGRKLLVAIDEIERVEDGIRDGWCSRDFLDFLRAAGDALHHVRFLLLSAYPLPRLGAHWTDRLVSATTRMISYLGDDDARELLAHPIPDFPDIYPEGGIDRILARTACHPYLLQKAGDDLCRLLNGRGGLRTATRDELTWRQRRNAICSIGLRSRRTLHEFRRN